MKSAEPQVGIGVIVLRDGKVLLGRRKGSHGEGSWALPGGHLEFGETIEACAAREVLEETGLTIRQIRRGPYSSDHFHDEGKHYVTLFVIAEGAEGDPELREPAKCDGWEWFRWSDLPHPLFLPLKSLVATGYEPR